MTSFISVVHKIIMRFLFRAFARTEIVQCGMSSLEYLQDLSHVFGAYQLQKSAVVSLWLSGTLLV